MSERATLKKVLGEYTKEISLAGYCECGERRFDLVSYDGLIYPPIHESTIALIKPELLEGRK